MPHAILLLGEQNKDGWFPGNDHLNHYGPFRDSDAAASVLTERRWVKRADGRWVAHLEPKRFIVAAVVEKDKTFVAWAEPNDLPRGSKIAA